MENPEVAQVFEEVADLLDLQGANPFRVRAYRNAARTIRDLSEPLAESAGEPKKLEQLDIPPIPEFIQLIADSGAKLYACKASVDMFGLTQEDFVDTLEGILTVGEFYEKAAGGQIIFT